MPYASPTPPPVSSDDLLPPVQPPSAGFLVQLFVIPGVIVTLMVLVWMLINWLPQMGNDAEANVRALEGAGGNRWQAAVNLANLLRSDSDGALKQDRKLASRLAAKLNQELADNRKTEDAALLRVYLATALGEFHVDDGLPALVRSVRHEEPDGFKPSLRAAAVRALAVLSNNLRAAHDRPIDDTDAVAAVIEASRSDDSLLRTTAAYTLGELKGDAAEIRLRALLDDVAHPYARYNAATALARRGEPAVIETLVEMLSTDQPPETNERETADERQAQRNRLVMNGLDAAAMLVRANPEIDTAPILPTVERLASVESGQVRERAKAVLYQMQHPSTKT